MALPARCNLPGLEAKFDEKDWFRWFGSFFGWWKLRGKTPHKWQRAPSAPESFPGNNPNKAKLALLGDWGTGLYGAPHCADSIAREDARLRGAGSTPFSLLMHLGDVYYSGTADEVKNEFLKLWPDLKGSVSRACNSNHEMYTGGNAYFELTLAQFGQKASYFAMQNDYWIVVGLDSAYNDPDWLYNKADLTNDQVDWLQAILATTGDRKLILLSHHQPFSYLSGQNEKLVSRLSPILTQKRVHAWYWGHEHRCLLYDRHPIWGFYGRCAGHSGYPYFRDSLSAYPIASAPTKDITWRKITSELSTFPPAIILDGPNPYIKGEESKYGTQGYITLEFDDKHLNEKVHTPDGTVISDLPLA
jgi:hypothetical protein